MSRDDVARFWDAQSATFDQEADHGLTDPTVRGAWRELLAGVLPSPPADVADLGCGTGSLAVLLAEDGFRVVGVDLSPKMIAVAKRKAGNMPGVRFRVGDASDPQLEPRSIDAVVVRHVTWALEDPVRAIRQWIGLLRDQGVLVMVEGLWETGAGIPAQRLGDHSRAVVPDVEIRPLTDERLWGGPIDDERYMAVVRT